MKKKFLLLLSLLTFFLLAGCSNDDSSEGNDILTGTTWYRETIAATESYSFGIDKRCHRVIEIEGVKPTILYFTYQVIDDNRIEIHKDNGNIYCTGEFNEEILTITRKGTGETETYKRQK